MGVKGGTGPRTEPMGTRAQLCLLYKESLNHSSSLSPCLPSSLPCVLLLAPLQYTRIHNNDIKGWQINPKTTGARATRNLLLLSGASLSLLLGALR